MSRVLAYIALPASETLAEAETRLRSLVEETFPGAEVDVYTREQRYGPSLSTSAAPVNGVLGNDEVDDSVDFPEGLGGVL